MVMKQYSVLMTVYAGETEENLREAMESMFKQSVVTNDFVLVCDGTLNDGLEKVISEYTEKYMEILKIIRIPKNPNWSDVLNIGLEKCENEYVARMDSDDISAVDRCEKQLYFLENNPKVDCVSTWLGEFAVDCNKIDHVRDLPETHEEIIEFAKKRCPLNHATSMYKKIAIIESGGYVYFPAFEDYHLWMRMISNDKRLHNLPEVLYYMRAGENLYTRRAGYSYLKKMVAFRKWMLKNKMVGVFTTYSMILINGTAIMLPNKLRGFVYKTFLRK